MLDGAVRRNRQNKILLYALMAKLVDAPDLGSGSARIEGSTPSRGTRATRIAVDRNDGNPWLVRADLMTRNEVVPHRTVEVFHWEK